MADCVRRTHLPNINVFLRGRAADKQVKSAALGVSSDRLRWQDCGKSGISSDLIGLVSNPAESCPALEMGDVGLFPQSCHANDSRGKDDPLTVAERLRGPACLKERNGLGCFIGLIELG